MSSRRLCAIVIASAAVIGVAGPAYAMLAPLVPIDFSNISDGLPSGHPGSYFGFEEAHGNGMVGWTFQATQATQVTHIGWYDKGRDGLTRDFRVGFWRDTNPISTPYPFYVPSLIESLAGGADGLTVSGGSAAPLVDTYRVIPLDHPVTLVPGAWYQIGGQDTRDTTDAIQYIWEGASYQPGPTSDSLSIGTFFYAVPPVGAAFGPTTHGFYAAYGLELGPMLFAQLPEPAMMCCVAVAAMGVARRRAPEPR